MATYFITGSTGLVGVALTDHLTRAGNRVVAYVRNADRAQELLGHHEGIEIVEGSIETPIVYDGEVDFIIHLAAPTGSSFFLEKPVETIDSIVLGTKYVLELAKEKSVKSVANLSSMEVYGTPTNEEDLTEDRQFFLDPANVRSNYPLAKRLTENLCVAYHSEHNVPVKSIRLAQVLAESLPEDDNRVVAQFIRAAKKGEDIKIATDGMTKQTYISMKDTISAILTVLENGKDGEIYNAANDSTYSSIYEVARLIADNFSIKPINVITNTDPNTDKYPPSRTLKINSSKLQDIGWSPKTDLLAALSKLASS